MGCSPSEPENPVDVNNSKHLLVVAYSDDNAAHAFVTAAAVQSNCCFSAAAVRIVKFCFVKVVSGPRGRGEQLLTRPAQSCCLPCLTAACACGVVSADAPQAWHCHTLPQPSNRGLLLAGAGSNLSWHSTALLLGAEAQQVLTAPHESTGSCAAPTVTPAPGYSARRCPE